ncbi:Gpi16 subunit, GPI transamidase component [Tuber magnatum]|uniref:Gpi16 subunit, GPI transamidase component n=1 Tax=Tuber magnatum TaxID=42249 RepID=A0A317T0Z7_9PEZI|nr:Gpi16 subunit, GPI transamidase component [Tuber magnatum]
MRLLSWPSITQLLLAPLVVGARASEYNDYSENLLLKSLPGNSILASFRFVSNGTFDSHHSVFPRSLAQILQQSQTKELHLKFTLGRWDAEQWGRQVWDGRTAGGTGVELWAWVEAADDSEADARWTTLNNALSGLFCASLNFIDSTRTIRPVMSFQPAGHHSPESLERLHLLHGTLPREPVCTENLTPFLKLLPCKGKAGISSLLDGHRLFDAQWQSMSIDVKPVCEESGKCQLQMEQTKPYAGGDSCFPLSGVTDLPWSLSEMFGRPIRGSCPLAVVPTEEATHVCVNIAEQRSIFVSQGSEERKKSPELRCFILHENLDFDIVLPELSPSTNILLTPPPVYASRSLTGHGQERGGIQAVLNNPSSNSTVEFVYLESLPWFMKPYLHTLSVTISVKANRNIVQDIYYRPALDRKRGTQLEVRLRVPPGETVLLNYEFEKAVLRYTEYPPDANRGFDIAPAIISILDPTSQKSTFSIRTTSLLLSLPTPDFSMPYNVIILTSTVMALAFGSIFNILVRRFVGADEVIGGSLISKIRGHIMAFAAKRRRVGGSKPKTE